VNCILFEFDQGSLSNQHKAPASHEDAVHVDVCLNDTKRVAVISGPESPEGKHKVQSKIEQAVVKQHFGNIHMKVFIFNCW
jgi:hypothetical protein